jgi:hypothetical protein
MTLTVTAAVSGAITSCSAVSMHPTWIHRDGRAAVNRAAVAMGVCERRGKPMNFEPIGPDIGFDQQTRIYAGRVLGLIRNDQHAGIVPAHVRSFAELHDYVDANEYLTDAEVPWEPGEHGLRMVNAVTSEVNRRLADPS